jgi:hypothetical protein
MENTVTLQRICVFYVIIHVKHAKVLGQISAQFALITTTEENLYVFPNVPQVSSLSMELVIHAILNVSHVSVQMTTSVTLVLIMS